MKQSLKNFFAELAGVDPSQIETSLDDEDFDMEGADEEEMGEDDFEIPDIDEADFEEYDEAEDSEEDEDDEDFEDEDDKPAKKSKK